MRRSSFDRARLSAQRLLHRCGVNAAEHVHIEAFAKLLGARLMDAPLEGAKAQLVRTPKRTHIILADRVRDLGARRFCIAHELGHLVLEHPSRSAPEYAQENPSADDLTRFHEAEANAFAAELLMPERLLVSECAEQPVTLDLATSIANRFRVSILASAIRLVELSRQRCAAVLSADGVVRWVATSSTFGIVVPRGMPLGRGSQAHAYFATRRLDAGDSTGSFALHDGTVVLDESVASHADQTVLSVLRVPSAEDGWNGISSQTR